MHELTMISSVLALIGSQAASERFSKVSRVCLEVGQLANVELDALRFCFEAVKAGSIANGAALEVRVAPGRGVCEGCGAEVAMQSRDLACPGCGRFGLRVVAGEQVKVTELEVE